MVYGPPACPHEYCGLRACVPNSGSASPPAVQAVFALPLSLKLVLCSGICCSWPPPRGLSPSRRLLPAWGSPADSSGLRKRRVACMWPPRLRRLRRPPGAPWQPLFCTWRRLRPCTIRIPSVARCAAGAATPTAAPAPAGRLLCLLWRLRGRRPIAPCYAGPMPAPTPILNPTPASPRARLRPPCCPPSPPPAGRARQLCCGARGN